MYTIKQLPFGNAHKIILKNEETGEFASILPEYGANLHELHLEKGGKLFSVLDGVQTEDEAKKNEGYKSSKLFPFPNRLNQAKYAFNNREYQLPVNWPAEGHAIHGLFDKVAFQIIDQEENEEHAKLILAFDYEGDIEGYPFPCTIRVGYTLHNLGLACATAVDNIGEAEMPVGDGWHPYFTLGESIDDCLLTFPACERIVVDEKMIPTGELEPYNAFEHPQSLQGVEFDTGFKLLEDEVFVEVDLYSPKQDVTLKITQSTGENQYNYLQIYTPPHRQTIAIEPMSCATDAFNNGWGVIRLKAGDTFSLAYGISLE